jgi:transcriptional regulator with XRE-family HTH domain
MTHKTLGKDGLPLPLRQKIAEVGQQIKLARKRRGMTMQEMAGRMFVTRKTIGRLESGDPGVSFGVLAAALLVLGLENDPGPPGPTRIRYGGKYHRPSRPRTKTAYPLCPRQNRSGFLTPEG